MVCSAKGEQSCKTGFGVAVSIGVGVTSVRFGRRIGRLVSVGDGEVGKNSGALPSRSLLELQLQLLHGYTKASNTNCHKNKYSETYRITHRII